MKGTAMSLATYATIPALLATKTPFKHGSCHAYISSSNAYVVVSYGTDVGAWMQDGTKHFNTNKYSVTTSRLQNLIRKAWGI
jgi:hypothetical protein